MGENYRIGLAAMGLGLITLAAAFVGPSHAQMKFPSKPIALNVGFSPGGRLFALSQLLGKEMEKELGQPVVVTAKPGGGGGVMAAGLKQAPPDGHTIGLGVTVTWSFNPYFAKNAPYQTDDFAYVSIISGGKPSLFASATNKANTLKELMANAKAVNETVTFASIAPMLNMEVRSIARLEGVKVRIVPAKGGGEAIPMILGGHADFSFTGGAHHNMAAAGKVKIIAATNEERFSDMPDVPTLSEMGYRGWPEAFTTVAAPKGTPQDVVAKLADALQKALLSDSVKTAMAKMNAPMVFKGPADTTKIIMEQAVYYKELIAKDREAN